MKSLGIRQTKAHLSKLVRAAAKGECSLITDNRKPVAMIGPPPQDPVEAEDSSSAPIEKAKALSGATDFRKVLLGVPSPMELDF
jgi:antitoxin (DNA-binding transcriptional repressor) of toxin-antitoxin stability system